MMLVTYRLTQASCPRTYVYRFVRPTKVSSAAYSRFLTHRSRLKMAPWVASIALRLWKNFVLHP